MKRMYAYVSQIWKKSDFALAMKMSDFSGNSQQDVDAMKAFLSRARRGLQGNISNPDYIWLLACALCHDKLNFIGNRVVVSSELKEILSILCGRLHAAISSDFIAFGRFDPQDFTMKGFRYLSMDYTGNEFVWTWRGVKHLEAEDIAIDIAEILKIDISQIDEIAHAIRETIIPPAWLDAARIMRNNLVQLNPTPDLRNTDLAISSIFNLISLWASYRE